MLSFLKNLLKKKSKLGLNKTRIDNHFTAQMAWIKLSGVWREELNIKYVPKLVTRTINWSIKRLLFLNILHVAIMFSITLYFDIQKGVFADITYSLSQAVIFHFIAFIILYFQLRENTVFKIVDFVNANFRYRSAKGCELKLVFFFNPNNIYIL